MYFEEKYGKTRVFEEKRMGNSRADILIITEKDFIGIEIKSDADTYARLSGQVKDYDRYCDYNYVVVGSTHGIHIGEHVPEYWGIITVEETEKGVDFYELRAPSKNPEGRIDNKLAILWRQEMAHIPIHTIAKDPYTANLEILSLSPLSYTLLIMYIRQHLATLTTVIR